MKFNQVEDIEVVTSDYIIPTYISDFSSAWDSMGEDGQVVETFALTALKSLKGILDYFYQV